MIILPSTYLGSVEYFARLAQHGGDCVIDLHENYVKRSERNRARIMTANGVMELSVHVCNANRPRTPMRDMRIDYSKRWQHQHWVAILSAYRSSPYFDYYAPMLEPFYTRHYEFLADYNTELTRLLLKAAGVDAELRFSEAYVEAAPGRAFEAQGHVFGDTLAAQRSSAAPEGEGNAAGSGEGKKGLQFIKRKNINNGKCLRLKRAGIHGKNPGRRLPGMRLRPGQKLPYLVQKNLTFHGDLRKKQHQRRAFAHPSSAGAARGRLPEALRAPKQRSRRGDPRFCPFPLLELCNAGARKSKKPPARMQGAILRLVGHRRLELRTN